MRSQDDLLALIERYLEELALTPELGELGEPVRYALAGGGKRIRPLLCLAVGEALGREAEELLPAAAALELVHSFSLVHDDLPALDDDDVRRGRPSTWAQFDEATAILAGDALLAEAVRLALSYPTPLVARELVQATLGMIGGQHVDTKGLSDDLEAVHRLKTGRLFYASVACPLWVANVPEREQAGWRAFAEELGMLFQVVDDILDGDGYVLTEGAEGARRIADAAAERASARLAGIHADTSVLEEIVSGLATRTS
ncbi:MAG TPA: polyprenyl synthetase family protein [Gaiellaceae bacterium]|jgi:geranylgeranyl diphosphate synthase type II|nr:polyprenyl synthetase family protein [Gaiellaceae bacterium]